MASSAPRPHGEADERHPAPAATRLRLARPAGQRHSRAGPCVPAPRYLRAGAKDGGAEAIVERGGKTVAADTTFMVSEDPVRGFWNGYRRLVGV
jgi:hypothetical protein